MDNLYTTQKKPRHNADIAATKDPTQEHIPCLATSLSLAVSLSQISVSLCLCPCQQGGTEGQGAGRGRQGGGGRGWGGAGRGGEGRGWGAAGLGRCLGGPRSFHVCFRSPSRRHVFSTFSDTFVSPFFQLFFTFISPFFHVLRRLYGHVFFTFFSRFPQENVKKT